MLNNLANWVAEKFNRAQPQIAIEAGTELSTTAQPVFTQAFERVEAVNRGVTMIVQAAASLDYDVKSSLSSSVVVGTRAKQLNTLLNYRPNPYQSAQDFRRNIFTDFLLEGNAFIYYDGAFLYHLPAQQVKIETDEKTYISGYSYSNSTIKFGVDEVFSFHDTSSHSIYRGTSRLLAAKQSIETIYSMQLLQKNFF